MRINPGQFCRIQRFCAFFLGLSLLFSFLSCSYLPQGILISEYEAQRVRAEFNALVASGKTCRKCLDARVVISVSSAWFKGSADGFLKVQSPDRLKYVFLNPLGQTMAILVTDGEEFHFLSLPERTSYLGTAEEAGSSPDNPFARYMPAEFPFKRSFPLFTGRLFAEPAPVGAVRRAEDEKGYWLEMRRGGRKSGLVLFDDRGGVVREYIILDGEGRESLKFSYDDYLLGNSCRLPGRITISSPEQGADVRLHLTDWRKASCMEGEFHYDVPPSFEEVRLERE